MKNKLYTTFVITLGLALLVTACSPSATSTPAATSAPSTATVMAPSATAAPANTSTVAPTQAPATPTGMANTATPTASSGAGGTGPKGTATPAAGASNGIIPCPLTTVEANATITFSGWGDETEQKVYRDSIDRFKQVCPGVTVNYNPIPTDFQTKLKAQMAGGTAPDVFYVDFQLMGAFASTGQLLPLDSYMASAGVKSSDFIPSLLSIFTLDGKTYGLPKDWGTLGLIYLPDAFKQAGIPEPTDQWTWDDLRTAARTIASKTKMAGFCQNPDVARFAPYVFSNGGSFTTPDFKTATLNTPEVKQMAQLIADMFKEKSLVRASDVGASWCGEAIGKQLAAMTLEGGWMVNFMRQNYANVSWKAVLIPKGSKTRADYIFTNAIGVNAATKYPNAAAAFALYLTSPANQAVIEGTGFAYSTHPDQIANIVDPNDKVIAQGGLLPDDKGEYWGPYTGKLEDAISKALERVYTGAQTVDDSFAQLQQQAQGILNGQ